MKFASSPLLGATTLLALQCLPTALTAPTASAQPPSHVGEPGIVLTTNAHRVRVTTIAEGLASPWSLALLPGGDMLVTERPGRLRMIRNGMLLETPLGGVPEVRFRNHGGLMDVVLHPEFETNRLVYLSYSKPGAQGATTAVLRGRLENDRLVDTHDVFVADAWDTRDVNFGSRIVFDHDGYLYISIGDRGPDHDFRAQDLDAHYGKIVRLYDDGGIPEDNPFIGISGARPEIYSYGHRNPQGLAVHPETGEVWASEHGPLGGDEVNLLRPGRNYGWPIISFGRQYSGEIISNQPWRGDMEPPQYYWVPSIGISTLLIYSGDLFGEWQGELIVAGLRMMLVQRVSLVGRRTAERESMLTELRQQVRDIREAPDGTLYLVTRSDADRTDDTGKVLRLEPVDD